MTKPPELGPIGIALMVILVIISLALNCSGEKECDARGGVYLTREMACVAPPPEYAP